MQKIGLFLTSLWVVLIGVIIFFNWKAASTLSLNEWGDFLAGITAPMAFLWLIIGYMLQSKELKMNTEALFEQSNELREQTQAIIDTAPGGIRNPIRRDQ